MGKKDKAKLMGLGRETVEKALGLEVGSTAASVVERKIREKKTKAVDVAGDTPSYPYTVGSSREETRNYQKYLVKVVAVYQGFAVEETSHLDWEGKVEYVSPMVRIFPEDKTLVSFIRGFSENRDVHRSVCLISLSEIVSETEAAEAALADADDDERSKSVDEFVAFLQEQVAEKREIYQRMLDLGRIGFELLSQHFRASTKVVFGFGPDHEMEAGVVEEVEYGFSMWQGQYLQIMVRRYGSDGRHFGSFRQKLTIPYYRGDMRIDDLPVRVATQTDLVFLHTRGSVWQEWIHKPQYLSYEGRISYASGWQIMTQTANGRCMIDYGTYERMSEKSYGSNGERVEVDQSMTELPKDFVFTAPGYLYGFSMPKKIWGKFRFSGLTPIAFRDDAYDLLVMDEEVKSEVRALVEQSENMFSDIISGKGGGAIFLLHGTPGLGKTLTAESVAEILHRPLYSISVGELGITPRDVEESLQEVLEMVLAWNAVLLLDEADIFLEARTKDDILRNAMVGVFLRLLEYHNGVLFLTTNRVGNFDTAVLSRISVILKYDDFTDDTRISVWTNILSAAGLSDVKMDLAHMAKTYPVNGRQIKNAIRISLSLAQARGEPVTQELIEGRLKRMLSVIQDLNGSIEAVDVPRQKPLLRGA